MVWRVRSNVRRIWIDRSNFGICVICLESQFTASWDALCKPRTSAANNVDRRWKQLKYFMNKSVTGVSAVKVVEHKVLFMWKREQLQQNGTNGLPSYLTWTLINDWIMIYVLRDMIHRFLRAVPPQCRHSNTDVYAANKMTHAGQVYRVKGYLWINL